MVGYRYFEGLFNLDALNGRTPKLAGEGYQTDSFVLEWKGQRTKSLKIGTTAEEVQNALLALSNIGAAGGTVSVTRSADGLKYNVNFGGKIWFRPSMLNVVGRSAKVSAVTSFAITKRDPNSTVKFNNLAREFVVSLPNPNTIPIDNSPLFTPDKIVYERTSERYSPILALSGALQTNDIGGRFDPVYSGGTYNYNVVRSDQGFRVTKAKTELYELNGLRDASGSTRPITLYKQGGLSFEVEAGSKAKLNTLDFQGIELELVSQASSLLVSAPFEGGRLTLRLLSDANTPIYRANLFTGVVSVTNEFEFVSFEIGGITIPASDSIRLSYDAAAEKFSVAINNLVAESPKRTGAPAANEVNDSYRSAVQVFEAPIQVSSYSYRYAMGNWVGHSASSFRNMLESFYKIGPENSGFLSVPPEAKKGYIDYFGAVYKFKLKVRDSGEYSFRSEGYGMQELRINGTVVYSNKEGVASGKINLVSGVEYDYELTEVNLGKMRTFDFTAFWNDGQNYYSTILPNHQVNFNGISSTFPESGFGVFISSVADVQYGLRTMLERQRGLTDAKRKKILDTAQIQVSKGMVTITNIPYLVKLDGWINNYQQSFASPVRLTIPRGTISITKGRLDPITDLPLILSNLVKLKLAQTLTLPQLTNR